MQETLAYIFNNFEKINKRFSIVGKNIRKQRRFNKEITLTTILVSVDIFLLMKRQGEQKKEIEDLKKRLEELEKEGE